MEGNIVHIWHYDLTCERSKQFSCREKKTVQIQRRMTQFQVLQGVQSSVGRISLFFYSLISRTLTWFTMIQDIDSPGNVTGTATNIFTTSIKSLSPDSLVCSPTDVAIRLMSCVIKPWIKSILVIFCLVHPWKDIRCEVIASHVFVSSLSISCFSTTCMYCRTKESFGTKTSIDFHQPLKCKHFVFQHLKHAYPEDFDRIQAHF